MDSRDHHEDQVGGRAARTMASLVMEQAAAEWLERHQDGMK
ncbi:hypothetical protein RAD15_08680 [Bradyrhizobium sp. 14AA]